MRPMNHSHERGEPVDASGEVVTDEGEVVTDDGVAEVVLAEVVGEEPPELPELPEPADVVVGLVTTLGVATT
jgi:hypothetical protein